MQVRRVPREISARLFVPVVVAMAVTLLGPMRVRMPVFVTVLMPMLVTMPGRIPVNGLLGEPLRTLVRQPSNKFVHALPGRCTHCN